MTAYTPEDYDPRYDCGLSCSNDMQVCGAHHVEMRSAIATLTRERDEARRELNALACEVDIKTKALADTMRERDEAKAHAVQLSGEIFRYIDDLAAARAECERWRGSMRVVLDAVDHLLTFAPDGDSVRVQLETARTALAGGKPLRCTICAADTSGVLAKRDGSGSVPVCSARCESKLRSMWDYLESVSGGKP